MFLLPTTPEALSADGVIYQTCEWAIFDVQSWLQLRETSQSKNGPDVLLNSDPQHCERNKMVVVTL